MPRSAGLRITYALGALIVLAIIFQLFFRYEYVWGGGYVVWRMDRLTGARCIIAVKSAQDASLPLCP